METRSSEQGAVDFTRPTRFGLTERWKLITFYFHPPFTDVPRAWMLWGVLLLKIINPGINGYSKSRDQRSRRLISLAHSRKDYLQIFYKPKWLTTRFSDIRLLNSALIIHGVLRRRYFCFYCQLYCFKKYVPKVYCLTSFYGQNIVLKYKPQ